MFPDMWFSGELEHKTNNKKILLSGKTENSNYRAMIYTDS